MNDFTRKILRKDIELSYNDKGDIEVLISPDYGAGWSTWDNNSINIAVDKRIIDYYKEHGKNATTSQVQEFLDSIGYENVYCGGWIDITLKTVPVGVKFMINEYELRLDQQYRL